MKKWKQWLKAFLVPESINISICNSPFPPVVFLPVLWPVHVQRCPIPFFSLISPFSINTLKLTEWNMSVQITEQTGNQLSIQASLLTLVFTALVCLPVYNGRRSKNEEEIAHPLWDYNWLNFKKIWSPWSLFDFKVWALGMTRSRHWNTLHSLKATVKLRLCS